MEKILLLEGRKFSSLRGSVGHILDNGREEVVFESLHIPPDVEIEKAYPLKALRKVFKEEPNRAKKVEIAERFIRLVETDVGKKKIRKNASWKEIVLSYPEEVGMEEVEADLERLLTAFREVFGFEPAGVFAVHRHEGRVHFHYIFSTRDLKTGKKIDLKPAKWIQLVGKVVGKGVIREIEKARKRGGGRVALKWIRVLQVKLVQSAGVNLSSEEAYRLAKTFVRGAKKIGLPKKEILFFIKHFEENPEENFQYLLEVVHEISRVSEIRSGLKERNRKMRRR